MKLDALILLLGLLLQASSALALYCAGESRFVGRCEVSGDFTPGMTLNHVTFHCGPNEGQFLSQAPLVKGKLSLPLFAELDRYSLAMNSWSHEAILLPKRLDSGESFYAFYYFAGSKPAVLLTCSP